MTSDKQYFVEIGTFQRNKHNQLVCGDTILTRKMPEENRYVAVLSDGLGSGVKANVLSTMTASMGLNFIVRREPINRTAHTIMNTLPVDSVRNISYSTFTIADLYNDGDISLVEYDNPKAFILRAGQIVDIFREKIEMENSSTRSLFSSHFTMQKGDRLVIASDGVTQSGIGTKQMPLGWTEKGLMKFVEDTVNRRPDISARDLARMIVIKSEQNDIGILADDTSCLVIYLREPRRLLLCTGPPFTKSKDKYLAETIKKFQGKKIVCGGTTSNILSRELNREIHVDLKKITKGLPPSSTMEGVDLMTEGIITLSALADFLEESKTPNEVKGKGPAFEMFNLLMQSDSIHFLVGTKINTAHQDPSLPVELEIRRNVVKKIAKLLEEKFLKEVKMEYI
jgi:hypothetical protein